MFGSHDVENALATVLCRGVDNPTIKETLSAFGGVKHRLQFVDEIKGSNSITIASQQYLGYSKSLVRI